jgi:hypothetical protein
MPENQRIVLLNRLITRSISHAPREHKPPMITVALQRTDIPAPSAQAFAIVTIADFGFYL